MIVVKVELHSAITGKNTELARMIIANDGTGTGSVGNYWGRAAKGVTPESMIPAAIMHESRRLRHAEVKGYPRTRLHVWHLVSRMLAAMGYAT